jgi:hypothetical protein
MAVVKRGVQFVFEILVAFLVAGVVLGLLIPGLTYLGRLPGYPWNAVLFSGVLLALVAATTLRKGGSLRRG